jgi:nuclear pore complex protein Nup188
MLTFGDIPHHAPVLLAWALLRHTLTPEETSSAVRKIGGTAIQLNVFQYLTRLLQSLALGGNDVSLKIWAVEHKNMQEQERTLRIVLE